MTLPTFPTAASLVFRDFIVDGNAGSGLFLPLKSDARTHLGIVEQTLDALISRSVLIGGAIAVSVNLNSLTIAIKTTAGNDPSATRPVYVDVRNTTPGSGLPHLVAITAPLSFSISAGSTIGFTSGVPGRLWIPLFYDAGTLRLGVFNAYGGGGIFFPLYPSVVATATNEGGVGGADSAGVFYSTAAITSKPFVVLGHLTWETALGTAGNWSAAPDVVHQQRLGDQIAGDMVQRQALVDGAFSSNLTTTPLDNTIPTSAEGVLFMTSPALTPQSKANVLEIDHLGNFAGSVAGHVTAALFQDAGAAALVAAAGKVNAANDVIRIALRYRMLAGALAATQFKVRAGLSTAGTTGFNGTSAAALFGGVGQSSLEIVERMG